MYQHVTWSHTHAGISKNNHVHQTSKKLSFICRCYESMKPRGFNYTITAEVERSFFLINLVSTPLWRRVSPEKPQSFYAYLQVSKNLNFTGLWRNFMTVVAGRRNQNILPKIRTLSPSLFNTYFKCRATYKIPLIYDQRYFICRSTYKVCSEKKTFTY